MLSDIALSHIHCNLACGRNRPVPGLIGLDLAIGCARLFPERTGDFTRVDANPLPPRPFVADTMNRAMMDPAQRHRELVADLTADCAVLCEAQVMRIRGLAAANQAGLLSNKSDVVLVADPARLRAR